MSHPLDNPAMLARIRRVAERMRQQSRLCRDLDETTQQLTLGVLRRLPKFDPARGPLGAFVTSAAKSAARTLIRDAKRAKRDPKRQCQLADEVADALVDSAPADDRDDLRGRTAAAIDGLTPEDAEVARDLQRFGVNNARKRLGLNRPQWVQTKKRLRLALEAENLGECRARARRRDGNGVSDK